MSYPLTYAFTFATPAVAITGMACVSIPILIHLIFRRKRKPVEWATMRFIRLAWETKKRRILLQKNILLFTRCCIPLLLGFALAEPLLNTPGSWGNTEKNTFIVIDDGIVSATITDDGDTEIDASRNKALNLIDNIDPESRIHIYTTTNPTKPSKTYDDHEAAKSRIQTIRTRQVPSRLDETLDFISNHAPEPASQGSLNTIHIISSFREGSMHGFDTETTAWPGWQQLTFSPPSTNVVSNTRIQSAQPLRSLSLGVPENENIGNRFIVELTRDGDLLPETKNRIQVETNNTTTTSDITWDSGQRTRSTYIEIPESNLNTNTTTIRLVEDDALPLDDVRYAMTRSLNSVKMVQLVDDSVLTSDEPDWMGMAINPARSDAIEILRFHPTALQQTDLEGASVVLITAPELLDERSSGMLKTYFTNGGLVIVTPPENSNTDTAWLKNINESFGLDLDADPYVTTNSPGLGTTTRDCSTTTLSLISDELPDLLESTRVYKWITITDEEDLEAVLRTDEEDPLISIHETESGVSRLVFISFSLDTSWTNIPTQPIIIPLIQEIIWGSLSRLNSSHEYNTGEHVRSRSKNPGFISLDKTNRINFDTKTGKTNHPIETPGFWLIDDSRDNTIQVNTNPAFSSTRPTRKSTIKKLLGPGWETSDGPRIAGAGGDTFDIQSALFYMLAILILVETIMARLFTHTSTTPQPRPS